MFSSKLHTMKQMAVVEGTIAQITIGLWLIGAPALPKNFKFSVV